APPFVDARHHASELSVAIDRRPAPRRWEVAPFAQLAPRPPDPFDRPIVIVAAIARPDAAAKRALHTLRRILELDMQPLAKRFVEHALRARLGEHLEERVDAGLDGPLTQQISAETVDRADVRVLEPLDRI